MPSNRPTGPIALVQAALAFTQRNTALLWITCLLLVLPGIVLDATDALTQYAEHTLPRESVQFMQVFNGITTVAVIAVTAWGVLTILLLGRRQIQNRAGRGKTSSKGIWTSSRTLALPFILTLTLRYCFIAYRMLLFLVPAAIVLALTPACSAAPELFTHIRECHEAWPLLLLSPLLIPAFLYTVQTSFTGAAFVADDLQYRDAITRSRAVVRGHLLRVFILLLGLTLVLFVPVMLVEWAVEWILGITLAVAHPTLSFSIDSVVSNTLQSGATMVFLLTLVSLYGQLRGGTLQKKPAKKGRPKKGDNRTRIQEVIVPFPEGVL